jgi:hypothetical protein
MLNLLVLSIPVIVFSAQFTYHLEEVQNNVQSMLDDDYSDLEIVPLLDESVESLALPFPFQFFEKYYNHVHISSNGLMSFSSYDSSIVQEVRSEGKHESPTNRKSATEVKDSIFVAVLKKGRNATHFADLISEIRKRHSDHLFPRFRADVDQVHGHLGMFTIEEPSPEALHYLKTHEQIESVSRNHPVFLSPGRESAVLPLLLEETPHCWGLDRLTQHSLPLNGLSYSPPPNTNGGAGVSVFVVDTGLDTTHVEFSSLNRSDIGARIVRNVFNYYGSLAGDTDNNGHGTHVAGTIGGVHVGVAPRANVYGVKVLNGQGAGTVTSILAGLDHVAGIRASGRTSPMVVSMSLGGLCDSECESSALNIAVDRLSDMGVTVVVASGNTADDACRYTPASASSAITVGAAAMAGTCRTL